MSRALQAIAYIIVAGGVGVGLFSVCKPSDEEIEKIKNVDYTKRVSRLGRKDDKTDNPFYGKSPAGMQKLMASAAEGRRN